MTEEHKKKIGLANLGRKCSLSTREKISKSLKGKHCSLKTEFKKGVSSWNKGIAGKKSHSYGRIFSEKRRHNISEAKKKYKFTEKHLLNMSLCRRGSKNKNWRGGLTELKEQIMNSREYRLWKNGVKKRDNYTCVKCGKDEGQMDAHHSPKGFRQLLKENNIHILEDAIACLPLWDISNGITLCVECHKETDNYGGVKFDVV